MGLIGKIIGGTLGFALGGPLGGVLGAGFGHAYDSSKKYDNKSNRRVPISSNEEVQITFFVAAFSMLAKLVKADGQVSEAELNSIDQFIIRDLNLDPESRNFAMTIFKTALDSNQSFNNFAAQFYNTFQAQPQLLELMIDILLRVSVADGNLSKSEEELILSAVRIFMFSNDRYLTIKSKYVNIVEKHYATLGCNSSDSYDLIKSKYRNLVSEYHPDKIASKGLPEEFIKFANDKFRQIHEAYNAIKNERGIK